ncbi:MAG: ferrous iron transport protein A [Planctomycetes bacterium]|nr:ferrous iron transport protein A [Planctomycetota bacterium]
MRNDIAGFSRDESRGPLMPLTIARPGEILELVDVRGGAGLYHRLAEMGIGPGTHFRVETIGQPGPFIVVVKGSRLILGQGMVRRIFVRPAGK